MDAAVVGWMVIGLPERPAGIAGSPPLRRVVDAARAAAKRRKREGGGTNFKGNDLAEFKRELLAEVWNTINDACAMSGPASGRGSTVESDDGNGDGSEGAGCSSEAGALGHGDPGASEVAGAGPRRGHEEVC